MDLDNLLTEAADSEINYPDLMTRKELYQIIKPNGLDSLVVVASFALQKNIKDFRLGFNPLINFQDVAGNRRLLFLDKADAEKFKELLKGSPDILPYDMDEFVVGKARCPKTLVRIDQAFSFPIYCERGFVDFVITKSPDRFDGMKLADRMKLKSDALAEDPVLIAKSEQKEQKKMNWAAALNIIRQSFKSLPNVTTALQDLSFTQMGPGFSVTVDLQPDESVFPLKNLSYIVRVTLPEGMTGEDIYDDIDLLTPFERAFPDTNINFANGNRNYVDVSSGAYRLIRKYTKEYKHIIRGVNEGSSKETIENTCKEIWKYLIDLAGQIKGVLNELYGVVEL